ncbi:radical SAM protein [Mesorhizobium tianshanense]|nr:radical SAM protein [Mesorhizobium tianshanense]
MHLIEILNLRHTVAAGVSIGITRRCPLHCAHCSTRSSMDSEQAPEWIFERFVSTFRPDSRPEILALSGGEALLRPELVRMLAERARRVGTRTSVLSGLFFAGAARIPPSILKAIDAVDHFSVSLDVFHEREVPRTRVFDILEQVLARGKDVSLHLVGTDADDPYLERLIGDVRARFGTAVPMLVNALSYFGRARAWLPNDRAARGGKASAQDANPCAMAAWPVVGFDGCIAACGNDDALDERPGHLILGHAATDDWQTIRERTLQSNVLRAIRLYGPEVTARRVGNTPSSCDGYCGTCMALSKNHAAGPPLEALMQRPTTRVLEAEVQALLADGGADAFVRRHGIARYAVLVHLGEPA